VIELCAADDLADGEARLFAHDERGVVLVRDGDAFHAYVNACPHFGIPLDVGRGITTFRKHVLCANHYAVFRFEDGACIEGPCLGASLDRIPIVVRDGRVSLE
jgi:nitrite reductase/ring-hydroxylating ferredoxin subunit